MDDVERAFREAHGQAVATLTRLFGDITLAEDAVQDAFVTAVHRWPQDGVPDNPAGWIVTTARNRAVDVVRRSRRGRELTEQIATDRLRAEPTSGPEDPEPMHDDQLRLIFTCCHPAIRVEHQVALTLRLIAGLTPAEVASAFLVSEETMAKRLVRAKYKIKAAHIPYRVPDEAELPDRLRAVLSVLYLIYNAGADDVRRRDLRAEAIRLTRVLVALMPDEPEAVGLLALMLLSDARMPARGDGAHVVLLKDQDRSLWDPALIAEGQALVLACMRRRRLGPFQLQAAIQALHCAARALRGHGLGGDRPVLRPADRGHADTGRGAEQGRRRRRDRGAGDRPGAARRRRGGAGRLPPAPCRARIDARKAGATARGSGRLRPRSRPGAYRH